MATIKNPILYPCNIIFHIIQIKIKNVNRIPKWFSFFEVACMDNIIGFSLDYCINYLGKCIVKICFALIDTGLIDDLKIVKTQMGVGEMNDRHTELFLRFI